MRRSVVLHGPGTCTISLPSSWVKKHDIQKGDELDIAEEGDMLAIRTKKEASMTRAVLDVSGLGEYAVKALLLSVHKRGYDEIEIVFDRPEVPALVREVVVSVLIGCIIVEENSSHMLLRTVSASNVTEFQQYLRRMFLLAVSMAEQTADALEKDDRSAIDGIIRSGVLSERVMLFLGRMLNRSRCPNGNEYYLIILYLKDMCEGYSNLLPFLQSSWDKEASQFLPVAKRAAVITRRFYDFFYKYGDRDLEALHGELVAFQEEIGRILTSSASFSPVYGHLFMFVQRMIDALPSVVGLHH